MHSKEMKNIDGEIIGFIITAAAYAAWGAVFYGAYTMGYDMAQK